MSAARQRDRWQGGPNAASGILIEGLLVKEQAQPAMRGRGLTPSTIAPSGV